MSAETIDAIYEAIRAHVESLAEDDEPRILTDWVIGYASTSVTDDSYVFSFNYVTAPGSTPQGSVGLLTMTKSHLMDDLTPNFTDD